MNKNIKKSQMMLMLLFIFTIKLEPMEGSTPSLNIEINCILHTLKLKYASLLTWDGIYKSADFKQHYVLGTFNFKVL